MSTAGNKSLVSRVTNSIRTIKKAWSEHPFGVLIAFFATAFAAGWAVHTTYLDFTGKAIVDKSVVASAIHSERDFAELKSDIVSLEKALFDRDSSIAMLREERNGLREELSAARSKANNVIEESRKSAKAMKSEFPSLVARGLWDRDRPSPKSISNARLLGEPLGTQAEAVFKAESVSAAQKASLVEIVAQYAESVQHCAPIYSRLKATNRFRIIGSAQDENQYLKERAEAEAAVEECNQQANQILEQVRTVLSKFHFTR